VKLDLALLVGGIRCSWPPDHKAFAVSLHAEARTDKVLPQFV
jgi:hypothetical protein